MQKVPRRRWGVWSVGRASKEQTGQVLRRRSPCVSGRGAESEPGGAVGSPLPWLLPEEETSSYCVVQMAFESTNSKVK